MGFFRLGKGRNMADGSLADAQAERDRLSTERDELLAALEREQRRSQDAEDRAREAEGRAKAAEARAGRIDNDAATTAAESTQACWPLVLGHLERRWAAGVGATPGTRGIPEGPVSAQLTESLGREVDRLREEVGVDVSFTVGEVVEPSNPVVFLLAATDLLGAMASRCERVTVRLDGRLIVGGEVWADLGDEIDDARSRAMTAGAVIDPVDVGDERVVVTLHP
ncbi:MAG: hypothetical protein ACRD2C_06435 [Acidimicrobiales bacterium]